MVPTEIDNDSIQESEPESDDEDLIITAAGVKGDKDDDDLVLSSSVKDSDLPKSDQETNKIEEEREVKVHEENGSSEVSPSDTSEGSKMQEEGVYGKGSKEVSVSSEESKHDIPKVSPSKVKVKAGGRQKDSLKVSTYDDLKVSQSKGHASSGKQKAKQGVAKGG
eukprot:3599289-Ditylum_brightwellii.AAC.1